MSKCPVCDWKIEGQGITVKQDGRSVVVCCKECAEKLAKQEKSKGRARR